jgi:hypothetical protein
MNEMREKIAELIYSSPLVNPKPHMNESLFPLVDQILSLETEHLRLAVVRKETIITRDETESLKRLCKRDIPWEIMVVDILFWLSKRNFVQEVKE